MTPSRGPGAGMVVFLACVFGLLAGVGGAYVYDRLRPHLQPGSGPVVTTTAGGATGTGSGSAVRVSTDQDGIVQAAAIAGPAAVKVEILHRSTSPFDLFFGTPTQVQKGIGSGFIFEYEGRKYVLTNVHVVTAPSGERAKDINIVLPDGRSIDGKLAGFDPGQDIACISLQNPPADTPTVQLGNSDALRVGEWVIAIGNPFNFEHSVTVGVVSARGPRPVSESESRDLIQTDAAINRGNSGGPLVNLAGQVVGINTMIYSGTGYSIGLGFAIPINQAKALLHYLVHGGPWIGVDLYPNSRGLARAYDLPTHRGVVVRGVTQGSPAARAGIRFFDVITRADGKAVESPEVLQQAIRKHRIGETVTLTIVRPDGTVQIPVKAGQIPEGLYGR